MGVNYSRPDNIKIDQPVVGIDNLKINQPVVGTDNLKIDQPVVGTEYNIHYYTKSNEWVPMASTIFGEDEITNMKTPYNQTINDVTYQILRTIKKMQEHEHCDMSLICGQEYDQMEIVFLPAIKYRRGTVYLVIQYSHVTQKVRILTYGTDLILHHAICFGTSLDNVPVDRLMEHIKEKLFDQIETLNIRPEIKNKLINGDYIYFLS